LAAISAWGAASVEAQSASKIRLLAIDANPEGNRANSLGPLDGCLSAGVNKRVVIDVIVDAIPEDRPIVAFQVAVSYDPDILEAVAVDNNQLISAVGRYQPFEAEVFNDPLPDRDGVLTVSVLDLASNDPHGANIESGPGVLSRITFETKAPGLARLAIVFQDAQNMYPLIVDNQNEPIDIEEVGSAVIAVGQACPGDAIAPQVTTAPTLEEILQPTPRPTLDQPPGTTPAPTGPDPAATASPADTPADASPTPSETTVASPMTTAGGEDNRPAASSGDSGGIDAGLVVLVGVLAGVGIVGAGAGGWLLYRRRSAAP
jgi:hypothetical protein